VNVPFGWKPPLPILKSKEGIIDLTKPKYEGRVHIVSGQQAYTMLSGSETFYDRLAKTLANVFQDSNLKDLIYRTKMSMNESS
jgi:ABC-type Fe3+ transport system substrate-binding protein